MGPCFSAGMYEHFKIWEEMGICGMDAYIRWVYDYGCRGQCAGRWVKVGTSARKCVRMSGGM